ncbi:MAG: hypothetical protein OIF40_00885 [Mangrovicoccus sp.]|nr:hypothetical protein [Mangrovicoccus sp.]
MGEIMATAPEIRPAPLWLKFTAAILFFFTIIRILIEVSPPTTSATIAEIDGYYRDGSVRLQLYCAHPDPGISGAREFLQGNRNATPLDFQIIYLRCPEVSETAGLYTANDLGSALASLPQDFDYAYFAVGNEVQFVSEP